MAKVATTDKIRALEKYQVVSLDFDFVVEGKVPGFPLFNLPSTSYYTTLPSFYTLPGVSEEIVETQYKPLVYRNLTSFKPGKITLFFSQGSLSSYLPKLLDILEPVFKGSLGRAKWDSEVGKYILNFEVDSEIKESPQLRASLLIPIIWLKGNALIDLKSRDARFVRLYGPIQDHWKMSYLLEEVLKKLREAS